MASGTTPRMKAKEVMAIGRRRKRADSVAAENPVAVVNAVADKKGTTTLAQEYLAYLWSDAGQNLAAELYLRPANADILAQHAARFPPVETFRPTEVFGPWPQIMQNFFADGGLFDQVSKR